MSRFWGAITGRTKPKKANLDSLFLVPRRAITLQTAAGFTPTGTGSVCFRAPDGAAYQQTQDEVVALLRDDPDKPDVAGARATTSASPGSWSTRVDDDVEGLCTDLHAVNTALEEQGFSTGCCARVVPVRRRCRPAASGWSTSTSRAPSTPSPLPVRKTRDNLLEIQVRDSLTAELPMEQDLQRWLALWGAPGL